MDWFESEFSLAKPPRSPRNLLLREAVDRPSDATLHHVLTEVQQVTELYAGEPQIGQKLLLVGIGDALNGLQIDDHLLSTMMSARKPSSKRTPRQTMAIGTWRSARNPRFRSSSRRTTS